MEPPSPVISAGDPLVDFGGQMRVDQDGEFRLAQHIDKSGSYHHASGIQGTARRAIHLPQGGDASTADGDVAGVPR